MRGLFWLTLTVMVLMIGPAFAGTTDTVTWKLYDNNYALLKAVPNNAHLTSTRPFTASVEVLTTGTTPLTIAWIYKQVSPTNPIVTVKENSAPYYMGGFRNFSYGEHVIVCRGSKPGEDQQFLYINVVEEKTTETVTADRIVELEKRVQQLTMDVSTLQNENSVLSLRVQDLGLRTDKAIKVLSGVD